MVKVFYRKSASLLNSFLMIWMQKDIPFINGMSNGDSVYELCQLWVLYQVMYVSYDSGRIFQQKGKPQNFLHKILYYKPSANDCFCHVPVAFDEVSDPQYAQLWFSFQTHGVWRHWSVFGLGYLSAVYTFGPSPQTGFGVLLQILPTSEKL